MIEKQGRIADRIVMFTLYITTLSAVLWLSLKTIDYALDAKFYYFYLLKWENCIEAGTAKGIVFPEFTGDNHEEYMKGLLVLLQQNSIAVPHSNSSKAYVYNISRMNPFEKNRPVFLLALSGRLFIYNLPETTFNRVDNFIDGKPTMNTGNFLGKPDSSGQSIDCLFKL